MMLWPAMIAGFTLGATGSLHCIGMCGPLSLALPTQNLGPVQKFVSLVLYQLGRILTYSLLGLIIGLAGHRIFIAGYQQIFSILLGTLILGMALTYFFQKRFIHSPVTARIYAPVQKLIIQLMQRSKGPFGFLLLGMANGLLPCGMVYIAMAATLSFSNLAESVALMTMFGAGTFPAMMMVGYAGRIMTVNARQYIRKMIPFFIAIAGALLILRGLNLGIPFLSPLSPQQAANAVICLP